MHFNTNGEIISLSATNVSPDWIYIITELTVLILFVEYFTTMFMLHGKSYYFYI